MNSKKNKKGPNPKQSSSDNDVIILNKNQVHDSDPVIKDELADI